MEMAKLLPLKVYLFTLIYNWMLLTLFLNPKYAPTNVSGTEIPNQRASRARRVVNGIAALLPFIHSARFRMKNIPNTILQNN